MANQQDMNITSMPEITNQPVIGIVVGRVIPPLIPVVPNLQEQIPPLIPVNQGDYYRTTEGKKELSVAVTSLMRHKDHYANLMPFEHIYNYIQERRRFEHSMPTRADVMHMLSRYTQRYPMEMRDGIQYWRMVKGRHAPHEDPMV